MINETNRYNDNPVQFANNTLFSGSTIVLVCILILAVAIVASVFSGDAKIAESANNTGLGAMFSGEPVQQSSDEKTNNLFMMLFVIVFLLLALAGGVRYLFNTSIYTNISGLFTPDTEIDVVIDHKKVHPSEDSEFEPEPEPAQEPPVQDEVFNIPGNYYGYDTAKNICSAYGSRLATYDEVETAYENGAEWCNYGWTDGQMALFPTQQDTYDKLQKVEGHENDCGRPGVNGGFMANPKVKYGVNCYGKKPHIREDEKFLMQNSLPINKTKKDLAREKEIDVIKKNLDKMLVSPFNYTQWSRV